jgi:hypothetical protein
MDDDPIVRGVIDEMEQEVSRSQQQHQQQHSQAPDVRTTNVAAFRHESPPVFSPPNQYMYQQQQPHAHYAQSQPPSNKPKAPSMFDILEWNQDDATISVAIAVIALTILSLLNVSYIYEKYTVLSKFQPYDIYIKTVVLAVIIYFVIRKFKSIN